jgi:hypothetical protein
MTADKPLLTWHSLPPAIREFIRQSRWCQRECCSARWPRRYCCVSDATCASMPAPGSHCHVKDVKTFQLCIISRMAPCAGVKCLGIGLYEETV